jgi:hypothetical protein
MYLTCFDFAFIILIVNKLIVYHHRKSSDTMIITKQIPDCTISAERFAAYWGDTTAYTQEEIIATLNEAHAVKVEHDSIIEQVSALTDHNIYNFALPYKPLADHLRPLYDLFLACVADEPCITSRTRSTAHDPFPVKEWKKQIAKTRTQIKKLSAAIAVIEQHEPV